MKNIINRLQQLPKKIVLLIAVVMIAAGPSVATASFYPERPIKNWNVAADRSGFDKVVFNSFINTPYYGDERHFFDARAGSGNDQADNYKDVLQNVKVGDELTLRTYVHNNGNQSLNGANLDGPTVAKNTKVRVLLPTGTAPNLKTTSFISADNATPGTVSDTAELKGASPFNVEYIPGSAAMVTGAAGSGTQKLSDNIVKDGAQIGYNAVNGTVPGCFPYQVLVYVKVKVKAPALSIGKKVKIGDGKYQEQVEAKPGDKVKWILSFKNTGTSQINNTLIRDILPGHLKLVEGSVTLVDSNHPNGKKLEDGDLFDDNGVNAGSYTSNSNGYITFETTVKPVDDVPECVITLKNVVKSRADNIPEGEDDASVVIRKDCAPEVEVPPTVTPPSAPVEAIPSTGPGNAIVAGLGISLVTYCGVVLARSRRFLKTTK